MSAFICNETHIATCARLIGETVAEAGNLAPGDVAASLAEENLLSVDCRYGDRAVRLLPNNADGDGERYVDRCRVAAPLPCSAAEGYAYLSCLNYQSCEHPEWENSDAWRWIQESLKVLVVQMRDELLDGRDVWEAGGTPVPVDEPFLCNPLHIAACAAVLREAGIFALRDLFADQIAEKLAEAGMEALGFSAADGQESLHILPNGMTAAQYLHECRTATPAQAGPADEYNFLCCLREQCRAGGENSDTLRWIDEGLGRLEWSMKGALLGKASVWEAPYSDAGTEPKESAPAP